MYVKLFSMYPDYLLSVRSEYRFIADTVSPELQVFADKILNWTATRFNDVIILS